MPEVVKSCPLCERDQAISFDRRIFRSVEVLNVLCKNCGLVYQTPRMTDQELDAFYQEVYREIYQGSKEPQGRELSIQEARAEHLVDFLKDQGIKQVERFLDIGCSSGLLMKKVEQNYHCAVVGIEPGAAYREYAQDLGLDVYEDLQHLKTSDTGKFDLVSMIHVLEHIADPVGYLWELWEGLLSKNGKLLVEVPNLYAHDCFEIAHLASYSLHTLSQVLNKAGFGIIHVQKHGLPRSNLIPLYITVLVAPYPEMRDREHVEGERLVSLKRRTGFLHRRALERLLPQQAWKPEYST